MLQADQPTDHDARSGAQTDHVQSRPPEQALNSSPHTWAQPPLLLHSHQLQVQPSPALTYQQNQPQLDATHIMLTLA